MQGTPIAVARAFHAAHEAGQHGDALRPLVTDDVRFVEHPNLVKPGGGASNGKEMMAASSKGAALLERQSYELVSAIEVGSTAILRVTWTGTIRENVGPFRKGQVLTAHIAQFVEARDGRVASIETFDCYEPFA